MLAVGLELFLDWLWVMYIWPAVVVIGLAYLGGVLLGPDIPEADIGATPDAASRSWNPHSTQQEGIARPRAYGKNMHLGNIVAKWTSVDGDDREVLHMIVEHGDGPTKGIVEVDGVKQVFLNDQPAANFGSVTIQERFGTLNQDHMDGFDKTKLEYELNNKLEKDEPIIFTTPNDFFDDLEYTIVWPNGLHKYHKSGGMDYSTCVIKVRIRVHGSGEGGWVEIYNKGTSIRTKSPLFKLFAVNALLAAKTLDPLERGVQYDLEFENMTGPGERHVNDVYIKSVREVVDIAFTRPGKALVGISAVATTKLHGRLDVKVVREDKIIWTWNGTTETIQYSRNRAWVVYDALTQPVISGEDPYEIEYYEGMSPSQLDLDFFLAWADFCSYQVKSGYPEPDDEEDRIACDTILDFQTDVWTFVNEIANIGRAYLYWQGHLLTGWIDQVVSEDIALVTMDNIMARNWKNAWSEKDTLAGKVEVFFQDSHQGYERMPAALPNESSGKYTNIISIEGVGITTRGTAIHVANHALKRNELIRNVNSFQQHKAAFRYKLGNVVKLQCKVPDWGVSYRVRSSSANNKVKLDRTCTAEAGELLWMQSYDAGLKKVRTDSYTILSVEGKVVTIKPPETWKVTPKKNYMVATGMDGDIVTRRIIKMEPRVDNYFDITVETYDVALFTADLLVPDLPDRNYIWAKPANPLQRPVTRQEVVEMIGQMVVPQLDVDIPWISNCTWDDDEDEETIHWRATDPDEPIQFRYKGTTYEITLEPFNTTEFFIYWDPNFTTSFRVTNDASVAVAMTPAGQRWMICRNIAGVAFPTIPLSSLHGGIIQAGTITAAYAQIADAAITTAKIKNLAVETLKIKGEAVTDASSFTAAGASGSSPVATVVHTVSSDNRDMVILATVAFVHEISTTMTVQLKRGSTVLYTLSHYEYTNVWPDHCFSVGLVDSGASEGEQTYTITISLGSAHHRSLVAWEIKK